MVTNNLMQALLSQDRAKALQMDKKEIVSKKLTRLTDSSEPVKIEIRELTAREISDVNMFSTDKHGDLLQNKMIDMNLMVCVMGITNPDLNDKALQSHYGAANADQLCEILFGSEAITIAQEIMEFSTSGLNSDEDVKEIKN